MKKILTLLTAVCLVMGSAVAEEKDVKAVSLWKASVELGYVATTGNTSTKTLNTKAAVSTDREKWRHNIEFTALQASNELGATADKQTLSGKSDYKLRKPSYLFVSVNYEDDKFSGYQYRVTEAVGYGRRVIEDSGMTLDLELGPGARQSKLDNGTAENETIIRAAAKLDWSISKTSKFTEALTVEAGENVTVTKSVTGLTSQINGSLSMKLTYTYKLTSEVPVGVDDTDTETAVTLVYNF